MVDFLCSNTTFKLSLASNLLVSPCFLPSVDFPLFEA
jgi:hypothetical protein